MKGSIRVSAKTLDDAITEALIQLGVTSDKLEYEVIEKGSAVVSAADLAAAGALTAEALAADFPEGRKALI